MVGLTSIYTQLRSGVSADIAMSNVHSQGIVMDGVQGAKVAEATKVAFSNPALSLGGGGQGAGGSGPTGTKILPTINRRGNAIKTGDPTSFSVNGGGGYPAVAQGGAHKDPVTGELIPIGRRGVTTATMFRPKKDGTLVNQYGQALLGYKASEDGKTFDETNSLNKLTVVNVLNNALSPEQTNKETVSAQLNPKTPDGEKFKVDKIVYDQMGVGHTVTAFFTKVAAGGAPPVPPNTWTVSVQTNESMVSVNPTINGDAPGGFLSQDQMSSLGAGDVTVGAAGATHLVATVTFGPGGRIRDFTPAPTVGGHSFGFHGSSFDPSLNKIQFALANGGDAASAQNRNFFTGITLDLNDLTQQGGLEDGVYGVARKVEVDGRASQNIKALRIMTDGRLLARYDGGAEKPVCIIPLMTFDNPDELESMGSNFYISSIKSGDGILNRPLLNGNGKLLSGTVEGTNSDSMESLSRLSTSVRQTNIAVAALSKVGVQSDQVIQKLGNA